MKVLGITGGVGSGKSTVLEYLEKQWGARLALCDDIARQMQEPGGICYDQMISLFGPSCVREDGSLDRPAISAQFFAAPALREKVSGFIYPAVTKELLRRIDEARAQGAALFVIEAAVLFESGCASICDEVWYVYADTEARMVRLMRDRGYSEERARLIMEAQHPDSFYRERCSCVIDNSREGIGKVHEEIDRALKEEGLV